MNCKTTKVIEVARKTRPVTDDKVAEMLEALRETIGGDAARGRSRRALWAIRSAISDREESFLTTPEEENHQSKMTLRSRLGGKGVQQEFTENLIGVKPDDEKTFVVDYPADYRSPGSGRKES